MKSRSKRSKWVSLFLASRPNHFVAAAAPVLVGSCLGYATVGAFNAPLFVLALPAIVLLQAGANMANDYFDHVSGNDWVNRNPTPFSRGSRFTEPEIEPNGLPARSPAKGPKNGPHRS